MEDELYKRMKAQKKLDINENPLDDGEVEEEDDRNEDPVDGDILRLSLASNSRFAVAKRIVDEVRQKMDTMTHGSSESQECSVCFAVRGLKAVDHRSGQECPQSLCHSKDDQWAKFRDSLVFRKGYLCFHCLLPTVNLSTRLPLGPC